MAETTTPTWDPTSWLKQWSAAMQLAPNTLVQPILPGWTLNVNAFNSSAPQTEAEVVGKHSYGRQLGRISEALAILVDARDPKSTDERFDDFRTMNAEIAEIKAGNATARINRLLADLDLLKVLRPEEHARLKDELKKRLPR
ncbi:hypothetical protein HZ992_11595 [Rhizobacter sp. AJA081-3]|uniref:hypothetical protein n=1 Tax=Rhizobacter sp. AJA081-3 TaxID=2753607 RepID=UPI001ADFA687|nr:hypothetical protein [Rhizobacter sp. AJA081-3]QTN25552.1 hypothetical protein HZ992_11595 [Rhizobacter sp. AJA081-3]